MSDELERRHNQQLEAYQSAYREIGVDLARALALIRHYQNVLARVAVPDPQRYEAVKLFDRYEQVPGESTGTFRVLVDGRDITDPPIEVLDEDKILKGEYVEGEVTDDTPELPPGDE